jgi:hypothetical protein
MGIAAAEKINESYVGRVLRLTLLAPEIVEAIVNGRQSAGPPCENTLLPLPTDSPACAPNLCVNRQVIWVMIIHVSWWPWGWRIQMPLLLMRCYQVKFRKAELPESPKPTDYVDTKDRT